MRNLIESNWVSVACDVCGTDEAEHIILAKNVSRISHRQHDYLWHHEDVQCIECGFVFNRLRPSPSFLRNYYADCWPISSRSVIIEPNFNVATRLAMLRRFLRPGARVYEIGDKLGEFHDTLVEEGYLVLGDDVMSQAPVRAEWLDGLFEYSQLLKPPDAFRMSFDAVLAYFVVEHLANVFYWLLSIRACLMQRGYLVIEVPHFQLHPKESLMHEHFLYLTPAYLSKLVMKAGYEVVEIFEEGASRDFGFSLIAQRQETETCGFSSLSSLTTESTQLRLSYQQGVEAIAAVSTKLLCSAQMAAEAVRIFLSQGESVHVCLFGANQTATDIVGHLNVALGDDVVAVHLRIFDNSDIKQGIQIAGFEKTVERPAENSFPEDDFYVWIITSRGWTQEIAEQINGFGLAHCLIIDGSTAKQLHFDIK